MYVYAYKELGIQNSFSAVNILIRIDMTVICTVVSNYNIAAHHSDEFQNEFLTCTILLLKAASISVYFIISLDCDITISSSLELKKT